MEKPAKNTICLWYDGDAEAAARFYAETFPDSSVGAVHLAPGDFPDGKKGDVLTVEFTVMGIPCLGLNGGLSWQITPIALMKAISDPDRDVAKRAFDAMMEMTKIDIAAIEAARVGGA